MKGIHSQINSLIEFENKKKAKGHLYKCSAKLFFKLQFSVENHPQNKPQLYVFEKASISCCIQEGCVALQLLAHCSSKPYYPIM